MENDISNQMIRQLKGAPMSIVALLLVNRNRTMTAAELAEASGYSGKTIHRGLAILTGMQLITAPRYNHYQLTGKERQLPLFRIETECGNRNAEFLPDPEIFTGYAKRIAELERRVQSLEEFGIRKVECGINSESGKNVRLEYDDPDSWGLTDAENLSGYPEKITECGKNFRLQAADPETETEIISASKTETGNMSDQKENFSDPVNLLIKLNKQKVSKYVSTDDTNILFNQEPISNLINPAEKNSEAEEIPENPEVTRWNAAMNQIKMIMGRGQYMTMLRGAVILGYADGHYTIGVDKPMVRDWLDCRCRDMIERTLNMMSDERQTVSFVVNAECGMQPAEYPEPPSLELLPVPEDPQAAELAEICNGYLLDPTGIDYSKGQLLELIGMRPDPRVLRFALPRMSTFESAKVWCGWDFKLAKVKLLTKHRIIGAARAEISNNDLISLELIDDQCNELGPENRELAIYRIKEYADGGIPE